MRRSVLDFFIKKAWLLRKNILKTAYKTGGKAAHLGGTMSCVEILISIYYSGYVFVPPYSSPKWKKRDRVIIGKGHAHIALYHIWNDLGFLSKKALNSYGKNGSILGTQLDRNIKISEYNTGSLGHAIGIANGICIASAYKKLKYGSVVLIGDGECESGSIWESVLNASKEKLNNLIAIVDVNRFSESQTSSIDADKILRNKFNSFGWDSCIINGHNFVEIFSSLKNFKKQKKPMAIIANTIKGKGVSFMENNIEWHHKAPNEEQFKIALSEYE